MNPSDELLRQLASEYVLGTLRGGARRRFEHWMSSRPELQRQVEVLQHRLAPMARLLPPASAPDRTWQRIEERLFSAPQAAADAASAGFSVGPADGRRHGGAGTGGGGLRGWASRWLAGWAALATAALAALVGVVVLAPERLVSPEDLALRTQQVPAAYVAVLSDAQGRPTLVASAARHGRRMDLKVLRPTAGMPGTQWVLRGQTAQGEKVVLGRIDLAARSRIDLKGTAERELSKLATLSVTVEPEGVALTPETSPTTVALLQGPCVKVW